MSEQPVVPPDMVTIIIDGVEHRVRAGQNLLHACISEKQDLPYFCWHPALDSIGACRQCAVVQFQDADDTKGRLVMACMTPATDGIRLSIADDRAKAFREQVIEWLMINHPHDCPVCEEGGDCHLQDMTVMTGHSMRRATNPKQTFPNQDLGPCIGHEMNRCITCYRCVRFYRDYAGGTDLSAFASKDNVYFGRYEDGTLESPFSGNLVEVCPTGVFTDRTFSAHYSRKWDLTQAPSVCTGCAVGCNIQPAERYGRLKRIVNRYHPEVNRYFICDRGRFGYDFVNSDQRLRHAGRRGADAEAFDPLHAEQADDALAELLQAGPIAAIGSPRATVEANFVLLHLAQSSGGIFSPGMSSNEHLLLRKLVEVRQRPGLVNPTVPACEDADVVLVLGEDIQATAPILALALRQAGQNAQIDNASGLGVPLWQDSSVRTAGRGMRTPMFIATPAATGLDDIATATLRRSPEQLALVVAAIASRLGVHPDAALELPDADLAFAEQVAEALGNAKRPLIVAGTGGDSIALLEQAANLAAAVADGTGALALAASEVNSLGTALLTGGAQDHQGVAHIEQVLKQVVAGAFQTLVILENNLFRRAPAELVQQALAAAEHVVVLDSHETATAALANLVLPAATFAEAQGTVINSEGRAQRQYPVLQPDTPIRPAWHWLAVAGALAGDNELATLDNTEQVTAACASRIDALAAMTQAAPPAGWRTADGRKLARQSHRFSGRTAMRAHLSVHEPRPSQDQDSPLAWSMEGSHNARPDLLVQAWSPGWNSSGQAITRFQEEVNGPLRGGNPGVRLLAPETGEAPAPYPLPETSSDWPAGTLRAVPRHEIFGSDELSAYAAAIQARSPSAYAALHPDDAAALGVASGGSISLAGNSRPLPLLVTNAVAKGCLLLPPGFPGVPAVVTGSMQVIVQTAGPATDTATDPDATPAPAPRPPGADIIARVGALLEDTELPPRHADDNSGGDL